MKHHRKDVIMDFSQSTGDQKGVRVEFLASGMRADEKLSTGVYRAVGVWPDFPAMPDARRRSVEQLSLKLVRQTDARGPWR